MTFSTRWAISTPISIPQGHISRRGHTALYGGGVLHLLVRVDVTVDDLQHAVVDVALKVLCAIVDQRDVSVVCKQLVVRGFE